MTGFMKSWSAGVECGGKRSATPLWLERLVLRWIRHKHKPKRRRASLAAALHKVPDRDRQVQSHPEACPVLLRPKVFHSLLLFSKLRRSNRLLEVFSAIGLRYGQFSTNSHWDHRLRQCAGGLFATVR